MRSERTRMSSERGRGRDRHVARPGERDCRQLLSAPAPHAGGNANDGSSFSLPRGRRPRRFWSEARGALRVVVARGIRWRFGGAFACRRKRPGAARSRRVGETVQSAAPRSGPRSRRRETLVLGSNAGRRSIYSILIKLCTALQYDRGPTGAEPRPGGESAARNPLSIVTFSQSSERSRFQPRSG